ncbi:hypothetical protein R9X47_16670 [Wukongibacter baidiensis]|uniref:hypothetical protein n=1 Tax=Wukongibacter baidiensis TaxID=1723361 RepID=UPI003D7F6413
MKRPIILVLTALLLLPGCTAKKVDVPNEVEIENSEEQTEKEAVEEKKDATKENKEDSEKIMADFKELLNNNSKPYEILVFIDGNVENISEKDADVMVMELEKAQNLHIENYTDILFEENYQAELDKAIDHNSGEVKVDTIKDEEMKTNISEMLYGGYKFVMLEGSYYPIVNYELLKKYDEYLPTDSKEYIKLMAVESNQLMSADAGLVISWEELANRTVNTEAFLDKFSDSSRKAVVGNMYRMYMEAYMFGMSNTPIHEWTDTQKIYDEVLNSYRDTVERNEGTITAGILKEYLNILKKNDFKMKDNVSKEIYEFYNEAIKGLGLNNESN